MPQHNKKDLKEKSPFRKRTEQARKWAERRSKSGREDPP